MSFVLEPKHGEDIQINAWNWVPTLLILDRNDILPFDQLERMRCNGSGGSVTAEEAVRIATFLDDFLKGLQPGERVLWDGTVTIEPDTNELFHDEPTRNYSAKVAWLNKFRDFCRTSEGFDVL